MGCAGDIKAVKLDRKGMLLLGKHLLHIKKKSHAHSSVTEEYEKKIISIREDTLKKEGS